MPYKQTNSFCSVQLYCVKCFHFCIFHILINLLLLLRITHLQSQLQDGFRSLIFSWPSYYRGYLNIIFNVKFWFKIKWTYSITKTLRWKQDTNQRGAKPNGFRVHPFDRILVVRQLFTFSKYDTLYWSLNVSQKICTINLVLKLHVNI